MRAAKKSRGEETGDEAEVHEISGQRPAPKKTAAKKTAAKKPSKERSPASAPDAPMRGRQTCLA
ncbi:hypothetical protein ACFWMG_25465 [Streptomyces sp. NPDC127074]|uniref:hypothetical protein n=1 Tax=Streptomyces sp. NPDC127074 TaxID=3347130 RepID=UPI0036525594